MKEYSNTEQFYDEARLKRSTEDAKKRGMGSEMEIKPLLSREERSQIAIAEALKRQEVEEERKKKINNLKEELAK